MRRSYGTDTHRTCTTTGSSRASTAGPLASSSKDDGTRLPPAASSSSRREPSIPANPRRMAGTPTACGVPKLASRLLSLDFSRREPSFDNPTGPSGRLVGRARAGRCAQVIRWKRPAGFADSISLQTWGSARLTEFTHLCEGQPLSFSASSVWGVSTRFRLQIGMIRRCEPSFGTPQGGFLLRVAVAELLDDGGGSDPPWVRWRLRSVPGSVEPFS